MIITTDRLRLRPVERKDIADFVRYLNDWDVQQWLSIPPFPYEEKDGETYLAIVQSSHATAHPTAFVVADRTRDSAFGAAAIDIDDQGQGELGYWFGRNIGARDSPRGRSPPSWTMPCIILPFGVWLRSPIPRI